MTQEKGSSGGSSNTYNGVQNFFFNFQTLSSKDDQSNERKKYVKNNFYMP